MKTFNLFPDRNSVKLSVALLGYLIEARLARYCKHKKLGYICLGRTFSHKLHVLDLPM